MPLLKVKVERKGIKRNMGGYFPTYIDTYLTLRSLAEAVTKSSIMQSILEKWVASGRMSKPEKQLIYDITQRLNSQWKLEKNKLTGWTLEDFKEKVHDELLSRGLSEEVISKIIKDLKK